MKLLPHPALLAACALPHLTSAWDYSPGYGFSAAPSLSNASFFQEQLVDGSPSSTTYPFKIGDASMVLAVTFTNFRAPGAETDLNTTSPIIVYTSYSLTWSRDSDTDWNDTVLAANGASEGDETRFCASIPLGLFSAKVTNDFEDGDCEGALGKKCVDALKGMGYAPGVPCGTLTLPDECLSKFPDGGIGSAPLTNPNDTNPYDFAYWSNASLPFSWASGEDAVREINRLHVVILSGRETVPLCARVHDKRVAKDSASTAGAMRLLEKGWARTAVITAPLLAGLALV